MMYMQTLYYDNGKVKAKLHRDSSSIKPENDELYDSYVDEISDKEYDEDTVTLRDWFEEIGVELDDIVPFVIDLDSGKWIDITDYC